MAFLSDQARQEENEKEEKWRVRQTLGEALNGLSQIGYKQAGNTRQKLVLKMASFWFVGSHGRRQGGVH